MPEIPNPTMSTYTKTLIANVNEKLNNLPTTSPLRKAVTRLQPYATTLTSLTDQAAATAKYPPLLLFINDQPITALLDLENDLSLVRTHSPKRQDPTSFLAAGPHDDRAWTSGLFELYAKATLLKRPELTPTLDARLPSGRDADIQLTIDGNRLNIECTVITDTDEDRTIWDAYLADLTTNSNATLTRPGQPYVPNATGPSPYHDTKRVYAKIYEKLAKDGDPTKTQLAPNSINIILLSCNTVISSLKGASHGMDWALDELFADQPRPPTARPGLPDTSLWAFVTNFTQHLVKQGQLTRRQANDRIQPLMTAPRTISGLLAFDGYTLAQARKNYNATATCTITHAQIATVEALLTTRPSWAQPPPEDSQGISR